MHPIFFHIGGLEIAAYGIFTAAGYAAAIIYLKRSMRGAGILDNNFWDFVLSLFIGAVLGGKILYVAVFHDSLGTGFFKVILNAVLSFRYGFVFYGGFIGACIAGALYCRKESISFSKTADCAAPAIALGHSIGRLGCFMAGCCYGLPSCAPWAVAFTNPYCLVDKKYLGIPLHPAQLYESAGNLALFLILHLMLVSSQKNKIKPGYVILAYAAGYGIIRFFAEFFRGDDRGAYISGLSQGQFISIMIVCLTLAAAAYRIKKSWTK